MPGWHKGRPLTSARIGVRAVSHSGASSTGCLPGPKLTLRRRLPWHTLSAGWRADLHKRSTQPSVRFDSGVKIAMSDGRSASAVRVPAPALMLLSHSRCYTSVCLGRQLPAAASPSPPSLLGPSVALGLLRARLDTLFSRRRSSVRGEPSLAPLAPFDLTNFTSDPAARTATAAIPVFSLPRPRRFAVYACL